jgi:hypothetical protein
VQWIKRFAAPALEEAKDDSRESPDSDRSTADFENGGLIRNRPSLQGDWTVNIGSGSPGGVPLDMYAAKYTFSPIGSPDCTNDFVVFPVNHVGSSVEANLLGVRNLYTTTCTGTVPTVFFAYNVGTGVVQTSPVLSLDGTRWPSWRASPMGRYFTCSGWAQLEVTELPLLRRRFRARATMH